MSSLTKLESAGGKKISAFSDFLDTLKQSLKASKQTDVSLVCFVDICKCAALTAKIGESPLQRLAREIDPELKSRLLNPSKPIIAPSSSSETQCNQRVVIDYIVASYQREPGTFLPWIMAQLEKSNEEITISFRSTIIKGLLLLFTKVFFGFRNLTFVNTKFTVSRRRDE